MQVARPPGLPYLEALGSRQVGRTAAYSEFGWRSAPCLPLYTPVLEPVWSLDDGLGKCDYKNMPVSQLTTL